MFLQSLRNINMVKNRTIGMKHNKKDKYTLNETHKLQHKQSITL